MFYNLLFAVDGSPHHLPRLHRVGLQPVALPGGGGRARSVPALLFQDRVRDDGPHDWPDPS